jgi:hypothetical protein
MQFFFFRKTPILFAENWQSRRNCDNITSTPVLSPSHLETSDFSDERLEDFVHVATVSGGRLDERTPELNRSKSNLFWGTKSD